VTVGIVVMPGEAIAKIAANAYVLRLELPERHARFIKIGDPVLIGVRELAASNAPLGKGPITLVYPELQDGRVISRASLSQGRWRDPAVPDNCWSKSLFWRDLKPERGATTVFLPIFGWQPFLFRMPSGSRPSRPRSAPLTRWPVGQP
jgi:hypothetical protein